MSLSWSTKEGCTIGPTSWPCAGAATRRGTGTCVRNFFCGCEKLTLIGPSEKSGGFFLVANVQMFTCTPVQCTNVHLNGCTLNVCTLNKCSPEQMFSERMFIVNGCTLNKMYTEQMFSGTNVHRTNVQRVRMFTEQMFSVYRCILFKFISCFTSRWLVGWSIISLVQLDYRQQSVRVNRDPYICKKF